MEPGIYFDLPMDEYLKIDAVSSSALRAIVTSPLKCWVDHVDPERERVETRAMTNGTALHSALLEGHKFDDLYASEFRAYDEDAYIRTAAEMKEHCKSNGLKISGTKEDLTNRLIEEAGYSENQFFDIAKKAYDDSCDGKTIIKSEDYDMVSRIVDIARKTGVYSNILTPRGAPEISIVWMDSEIGMLCKARPDWTDNGYFVALKTFSNPLNKQIRRLIPSNIYYQRYHIELAFYLRALKFCQNLPIHGGDAYPTVCEAIRSPNEWRSLVLSVETGRVNHIECHEFAKISAATMTQSLQFAAAHDDMIEAMRTYRKYTRSFGLDRWQDPVTIKTLDDSDFPYEMIVR